MVAFARRRGVSVTEWAPIKVRAARLMQSLGTPHDVMMFIAPAEQSLLNDVYLCLPDKGMLQTQFPGFVLVDRSELPDNLSTLIAREDGFEKLYPDIYSKRSRGRRRRREK
ncbi:hypothetical protein [Rhodoplanes sp. Z2-YC6860]|uniref:hypothetical protein n=1 Tax=Rhodoplanes sp. Z2-YC6860 TaxID=674703 RepID=UPI0012EDEA1B|nr:hypothetical protein [Rhodoplanes sp. Z2-YC6860]